MADEQRKLALLPQMQTLVKHFEQSTVSSATHSPEFSRLLFWIGNVWSGFLANARQAKTYYERALTIDEAHYGPDHWEVASTLTANC